MRLAAGRDVTLRDGWVEAAALAVGQDAVGHLDAGLRPLGDRAAGPELGVVGVRDDGQGPLDLLVRQRRHLFLFLVCSCRAVLVVIACPAAACGPRGRARRNRALLNAAAGTGDPSRRAAPDRGSAAGNAASPAALAAALRALGVQAQVVGLGVAARAGGQPPLRVVVALRPDGSQVWLWEHGGGDHRHPCADPRGAAALIAACLNTPAQCPRRPQLEHQLLDPGQTAVAPAGGCPFSGVARSHSISKIPTLGSSIAAAA